jgi:cell division protein FtsW
VFILRRALRAALRAPDSFGSLLAMGIGMLIFMSGVINIAMTTGVIPTAGLPLPFISYGGSSLVTSLAAIGIIVSVSSEGKEHRSPRELFGLRRKAQSLYARRK